MRLLVATDAAPPQVNGVVRSLEQTAAALARIGVETVFLAPDRFPAVPLPSYPEIRLALVRPGQVARIVAAGRFDAIHVATEGPVGLAARRFCLREGLAFTTSYHTRFPEYLRARAPIPLSWSHAWLRRFHNAGAATMVSTESLRTELAGRGFRRLKLWTRGVDTELFRPRPPALDLPRPIFLSVGRLAVEKNLAAFLRLDLPGTKVVVGDGPQRAGLEAAFPDAVFLGIRTGAELAAIYASADVFVFPSLTDTYGIVLLEALASGLPVAAFPVSGPKDVVGGAPVAALGPDLREAALAALAIPRERCRAFALARSWERSAREFLAHVAPLSRPVSLPPRLVLRSAG
ncbi:glycosyltransferase family 4 protein [Enterovirga aerilata]|uniref:Glycosyltransferase family 1 protein n=1 Tax=Enterovirga aerilata TaxID=2730920 RepID=A0A849I149_9HYPH|nr:glycosyltransferase family 1 protein [Enterovirga sp. DB1703]NNM73496.1 glycosyltransferase family 1 protein [Enterovirga sp. DB1703]